MEYILMHKDIKVLKMDINSDNEIAKIITIYDLNHMPFATINKKNDIILL